MRFSPLGDGTGAVVAVEVDVRRLVQGAEGVAEGLDDALAAVGEFVQGAQVEVEVGVHGRSRGRSLLPQPENCLCTCQLRFTRSAPEVPPCLVRETEGAALVSVTLVRRTARAARRRAAGGPGHGGRDAAGVGDGRPEP